MSDPLKDVNKEFNKMIDKTPGGKVIRHQGSKLAKIRNKFNDQVESAFAFDFVPGDPEGDAKPSAEKLSLDQRVIETARRRSARYGAKPGGGMSSNILTRSTLG